MKTLQNITDEIMGYIADKDYFNEQLKRHHFGEPTNVLPLLRENIKILEKHIDDAIDAQANVWEGNHSVKVIYWNLTENGEQYMADHEADLVFFSYRFPENPKTGEIVVPSSDQIMESLMAIMLSDCTGCCDALKFITVSYAGILAHGDISAIYHS